MPLLLEDRALSSPSPSLKDDIDQGAEHDMTSFVERLVKGSPMMDVDGTNGTNGTGPAHITTDAVTGSTGKPPVYVDTGETVPGKKMARGVKKLMDTINRLRQLGIEDLVVSLPKIVVVGDQSSGKSSCVEALSEIKVPRFTNTCTRCPLEINLTESPSPDVPWSCEVRLQRKFEHTPEEAHHENSPYPHFRPLEMPEDEHFQTVTQKDQLEVVLGRAQAATLQPHRHRSFRALHTSAVSNLKFSPNIVRLDITGPGLPNLSFYDLPGVINRAENAHESHLVDLVQNLVAGYVQNPKSLILLAQGMNIDPNNSTTAGLVVRLGAQDRCMGVLTKPDLIGHHSTFDLWRDILKNDKFTLRHEYYVTKQPDQELLDCGITHSDARKLEAEFFSTQSPWNTDFKMFATRFGTENLQTALAENLTMQYLANLDDINEKVQKKAEDVGASICALPQPPSADVIVALTRRVDMFVTEVKSHLDGRPGRNTFQRAWNQIAQEFRVVMESSQPDICFGSKRQSYISSTPKGDNGPKPGTSITSTPTRRVQRAESTKVINLDEHPPALSPQAASAARKRNGGSVPETPRKRPKQNELHEHRDTNEVKALGRQYTCSDIESHLQDCYSNGIPDTVDATAIHDLCFESIEHWEAPMRLFLNKTEKMVKALLVDLVKDVFSDYHRTALMGKVKSIVTKLCDQVQKEEHILAARFYECERVRQATLDIESHRTAEEEALKRLKVMYVVQRINDSLTETEPENKKTEGSDRAKIVNKQLQSENLDTLKCSPALAVIAKVQAYYKIAMSRFVDNIFLSVQAQVFARIAVEISAALEQRLGLLDRDAHERCARLVAQDPAIEDRRVLLEAEQIRLKEALDWLKQLSDSPHSILTGEPGY